MGKHYPEDIKRAAVARILQGEAAMAVARSIGINSNSVIYSWRDKYAADIKQSAKLAAKMAPAAIISDKASAPHRGPKGRAVYPDSFKQQAVALVKIKGLSKAQAATQMNVPAGLVRRWIKAGYKPQLPAVIAPAQVVSTPTRQHAAPSPYSRKDARQYLLMWEQCVLAGIREGRIKNLREHPEHALALNALVALEADET